MRAFPIIILLLFVCESKVHGQEQEPEPRGWLQRVIRQRYLKLVEEQSKDWSEARLEDEISRLQVPSKISLPESDNTSPGELRQRLGDDLVLLLQGDIRYLNIFAEQHPDTEAAIFAALVSRTLSRTLELARAWGEGKVIVTEGGKELIYGNGVSK